MKYFCALNNVFINFIAYIGLLRISEQDRIHPDILNSLCYYKYIII